MSDLISRQAAIDLVKDVCDAIMSCCGSHYDEETDDEVYDDIREIDAILKCNKEMRIALKNMPSAHPNWIPCSERLPENEYETYWVCTDTGYQCECRWTNVNPIWTALTTDWHWNIFDTPQYTKVVAWMPLPEPYKGDPNE